MKRFILTAAQWRRLQARVINLAVMYPGEIVETAPRSFFPKRGASEGCSGMMRPARPSCTQAARLP